MRASHAASAAAALLAALALAGPASASQVAYDGQTLTYSAGPGEANKVLVSVAEGDVNCGGIAAPCLTIDDSGARISVGTSGCVVTSSISYLGDSVACPVPQRVRADLGDGDDAYWDWNGPSTVGGGGGNDNPIFGAGGDDTITGGPGNDVLYGDAARAAFIADPSLAPDQGRAGSDLLQGGAGRDFLYGDAPVLGGFRWSSQHRGGGWLRWLVGGVRTELCGRSLLRLAARE
jgi:Ca2+-binding RTX toxin-like protein